MAGIYTITNLVNNKIYVGQAVNFNNRKAIHFYLLKTGKHFNSFLQNSYIKYGKENFKFEVLSECSLELLNSEEHYWCILLNTRNRKLGYNIKITNPNGKFSLTEETKNKISQSHIGIKHTPETCLKLSLLNKGKKYSEEVRTKMSLSQKKRGFKMSEEHKKIMIGSNISRKGNFKKETLLKMSLSKSKPVYQYSLDGILINEYKNITEASEKTLINLANISMVAMGKRKSAGKFKWEFKLKNDETLRKY